MKYTFFIIICVFPLLLSSQNSYMHWTNGSRHRLGVKLFAAMAETLEVKKPAYKRPYFPLIINDTFHFINTADTDLVIKKINTNTPWKFRFTEKVKPGKKGYIVYTDTIPFSYNGISHEVKSFNLQNNFSPWIMIETEFVVVYPDAKPELNRDGQIVTASAHKADGKIIRLECYPGSMPRSLGVLHVTDREKLGVWKYWDSATGEYRAVSHTKQINVRFSGETYGNQKAVEVFAHAYGDWYKPLSENIFPEHAFHIREGTDTLRFILKDSSNEICFKYSTISDQSIYDIELMKAGTPFYYYFGYRKPVYFSERVYFFRRNPADHSNGTEDYITYLERRFPGFEFGSRYTSGGTIYRVSFPDYYEADYYLKMFLSESSVEQLFRAAYINGLATECYIMSKIYVSLRPLESYAEVEQILRKYGLSRGDTDTGGGTYLNCNFEIVDEEFLELYNKLFNEPVFMSLNLIIYTPLSKLDIRDSDILYHTK